MLSEVRLLILDQRDEVNLNGTTVQGPAKGPVFNASDFPGFPAKRTAPLILDQRDEVNLNGTSVQGPVFNASGFPVPASELRH